MSAQILKNENSTFAIVLDELELKELLHSPIEIDIAIFSAWQVKLPDYLDLELIISKLKQKQCLYFICVGTYAEALHDLIDDELAISEDDDDSFIVTTWHTNDTTDQVVDFIAGLDLGKQTNFLAYFNKDKSYDAKLAKQISKKFI